MTLAEICSAIPEAFLLLSTIVTILHAIYVSSNSTLNFPLTHTTIIALSLQILISTFILINVVECVTPEISIFDSSIILDTLSVSTKKCLLIACFLCVVIVTFDLKEQLINSFEYTILVMFSVFGAILMSSSNDLITAYLAIEVQSLSFYILAAFKKNSTFSMDAGLKYFILGALGSSTFLFGSSLIYGITGTTNFEHFHKLYSNEYIYMTDSLYTSFLLQFGLILILCSLFFKLSIAPFHIWSPDVYEGSLSCSTFIFSIIPKLGLFVLLIRIFFYSFENFIEKFRYIVIFSSLLSIFIGSFGGLEQIKVKTLLAYSSISHMGYGLLAFSSGVVEGIQILYCYVLVYMLSGITLWSIFFSTKLVQPFSKHNKDLADFTSILKSNSSLAICLVITLLSLAGFPPFVGFYAKMAVFSVVIESSMYSATIIAILCGVISTYYYIRIIKISYFEQTTVGRLYYPSHRPVALIISLGFCATIGIFVTPSLLYLFCYNVSLFSLC